MGGKTTAQKENNTKLGAAPCPLTGNTAASTGIITASSWRIGEALVQKQLKQHLRQQQQQQQQQSTVKMDRMNILSSMKLGDNGEEHSVQLVKKNKEKKLINEEERRASSSKSIHFLILPRDVQ